jgi:hypothetical protein
VGKRYEEEYKQIMLESKQYLLKHREGLIEEELDATLVNKPRVRKKKDG